MKRKILFLVIFFIFFSGFCLAGTQELKYLQGEWVIIKWASSPIGSWFQDDGDACVGDRLIIKGDQALMHLEGRSYKGNLGKIIHKKVQNLDHVEFFDPNEKNTTDPKDLGLSNDLSVESLEMDSKLPFKYWVLLRRENQIIFFQESGSFLMERLKTGNSEIKKESPDIDAGWNYLNQDQLSSAITSFLNAIKNSSEDEREAYLGLGYTYKEMSNSEPDQYGPLAIKYFARVLELTTSNDPLRKTANANIKSIQDLIRATHELTPGK